VRFVGHDLVSSSPGAATQKTTPDTELRNPADLVDELVFFAGVAAVDSTPWRFSVSQCVSTPDGNARTGKGGCITSGCGHKYHLLGAAIFPKVILPRPAFGELCCFRLPFPGVSAGRVSAIGARATPCAQRQLVCIKKMHHRSYARNRTRRWQRIDHPVRSLSVAAPLVPAAMLLHFAFCSRHRGPS